MKYPLKLKCYRLKYKRYYGIEFDSNYVVHHIDFDRNNNDISNLLLMPKDLHQDYHIMLQRLCGFNWKDGKVEVITTLDRWDRLTPFVADEQLIQFLEIARECAKWVQYKHKLDLAKHHERMRGFEHG